MPEDAKDSNKENPSGKKFDWNKVYVGGGMGMQFGSFPHLY